MADFFHHQKNAPKESAESGAFDAGMNCFLCLENIFKRDTLNAQVGGNNGPTGSSGIKIEGGSPSQKIPLRSICRYLGIDFQKVFTGNGEKFSSDEMYTYGTFCNQCFRIVSPLSGLCNQLELLQMKLTYYLKSVVEVAECLSAGKATNNSMDERNQRFTQQLRMEIRQKGQVKLNQAIPKVKLVKISSVQLGNNFSNAMPLSERKIGTEMTSVFAFKLASYDTKSSHVRKPAVGKSTQMEFKCNVCGKLFKDVSYFYKHKKLGHDEEGKPNVMNCNVCGKLFKDASQFYKHRKLGHDEQGKPNVIKCEICGKVFTEMHSLMAHKQVIHEGGKDNFKCDICSSVFRWKNNLQRHVKVVHNQGTLKPHVCNVCGKVFKYGTQLYRHKKFGHDKEGKPNVIKCEICDKTFTTTDNLMLHKQMIHQGVNNNLRCWCCGKAFRWKSNLEKHVELMHNKDRTLKRYVCSVCGKVFTDASHFNKHKRLGHDEQGKPNLVPCEVCGKVFTAISSMMAHKKVIHEGVGPKHNCVSCGKVFPWKSSLRNHVIAVHNKERALKKHYVCSVCDNVFSTLYALQRHMITQHERKSPKGQEPMGDDFDETNLNLGESEPVVKACILPKFIEEQDNEQQMEGSKQGMHVGGSADYDGMQEEQDNFYTEYVTPGVSSNRNTCNDHFDCHSEEIQVEMKILPD